MRLMLVLIISYWLVGCKSAQPKVHDHNLPLEYENSRYNTKCTYSNRFSLENRQSRMPFRKSKKVVLVSYDGGVKVEPLPNEVGNKKEGLIQNPFPSKYTSYNGVAFYESFLLDEKQVDGLTNILFNYAYWRDENEVIQFVGPTCYSPRHMILFYGESNDKEPFAWIEICLQCKKHRAYPGKFDLGNFCEGKYDLLREFFRQTGITYGLGD